MMGTGLTPQPTCRRGHDLTNEDNVYRRSSGKRECAVCRHLRHTGIIQPIPKAALELTPEQMSALDATLMQRMRAHMDI